MVADTLDMERDPENHLKAWRKFRGFTQQALADAVEPTTTKQVIQALESGGMQLSAKWLRRLAPALQTTPGFLLDHDPNNIDSSYVEEVMGVPQDRRAEALDILRVLKAARKR